MECLLTRETELSSDFVDATIRGFGSSIWIQKQLDPLRCGTPDIYAMSEGVFLPIECKRVALEKGNSILSHHFTKIQKKRMRDLLKVGAYPVGLIFREKEQRYILPLAIRADGQISMDEYNSLPIFNWTELINAATKEHRDRFKR